MFNQKPGLPPSPRSLDAPPPADDPSAPSEQGSGDLTPEMLDYSGPDEQCQYCKHFSSPATCDRWSDPVEPEGHCEGFQAAEEGEQQEGSGQAQPAPKFASQIGQ